MSLPVCVFDVRVCSFECVRWGWETPHLHDTRTPSTFGGGVKTAFSHGKRGFRMPPSANVRYVFSSVAQHSDLLKFAALIVV